MVKVAIELTAAHEDLVFAILIAQLGNIAPARLKLDGDQLLVKQVNALEDNAERALANPLADAVAGTHDARRVDEVRHGSMQVQHRKAQVDNAGKP